MTVVEPEVLPYAGDPDVDPAVLVTDTAIDSEHFILEGIDTSKGPRFKVSDVAKFFFGRTSHWIRWLEAKSGFVLGDPACPHSEPVAGSKTKRKTWVVDEVCTHCQGVDTASRRTIKGARIYTLSDVEQMVHALASNGHISGAQAANALHIVLSMARIWEFTA